MPLPVTKGEFNRLGTRLIAADIPSETDLRDLAAALAVYQQTLEQVKTHLHTLGFAPSGRVKTTTTMTDKLRRTHGMELSRMQDLAGARLVVHDLAAQDEARDKISEFYARENYPCRVIDRRADPRFGYRAIHLVVRVDDVLTEIQIRTDLQDSWAQIVERLADHWGRGIRYGQDPEDPEAVISSGGLPYTRRELVAELMNMSEITWSVESARHSLNHAQKQVVMARSVLGGFRKPELHSKLQKKIPAGMIPIQEAAAQELAGISAELDAESQGLLNAGADITVAQLIRMFEILADHSARTTGAIAAELASSEQRLRDTLQMMAAPTTEGA
jgi:ppGpp synthetase/RelA/SpoT-type nucleotidyltranferase